MVFGPFSAVFCTRPIDAVAPFCRQPVMVCSAGGFFVSCAETAIDSAKAPAAAIPNRFLIDPPVELERSVWDRIFYGILADSQRRRSYGRGKWSWRPCR